MMVSSLFLPAACRCVLSPLYPVPTHLKRGICIVFSANNIHVYSSIFTVFPSSPQVFPRESGPFPRRKSPSVGSEAVFFPAAAGLVKAAGPSRPTARVLGGRRPAPHGSGERAARRPRQRFARKHLPRAPNENLLLPSGFSSKPKGRPKRDGLCRFYFFSGCTRWQAT